MVNFMKTNNFFALLWFGAMLSARICTSTYITNSIGFVQSVCLGINQGQKQNEYFTKPVSRTTFATLRMAVSGGGKQRRFDGPKGNNPDEQVVLEKFGKIQAIRQRKGEATGIRGSVKTQGRKWDNLTPVPPSIRVTSGTAKGRKLTTPDVYLRPMMGKVISLYLKFFLPA
jgi:hypothetical protein